MNITVCKGFFMKRFLYAMLFFLSATMCATQMKEQRERFKKFVQNHGWQIPTTREKTKTFIGDLADVFGEARNGRRPSCMRDIMTSYYGGGSWLHHPRLTDEKVRGTARSLMSVAEDRFGKPALDAMSTEAVCNDQHKS